MVAFGLASHRRRRATGGGDAARGDRGASSQVPAVRRSAAGRAAGHPDRSRAGEGLGSFPLGGGSACRLAGSDRFEQPTRGLGDLVHRIVEGLGVCPRRNAVAAHLPDELERGGMDLVIGGGLVGTLSGSHLDVLDHRLDRGPVPARETVPRDVDTPGRGAELHRFGYREQFPC